MTLPATVKRIYWRIRWKLHKRTHRNRTGRFCSGCGCQLSDSPFPQPPLETLEKGLRRDREIPGKPADSPFPTPRMEEIGTSHKRAKD